MERLEGQPAKPPELWVAGGINTHYAQQLIEKSNQEHIKKWTPQDAATRFKDIDSFSAWVKEREVYLLIEPISDDVGGVIWYGRKNPPIQIPPPTPSHTFAIRLYEGYVGEGLSQDFMRLSFSEFISRKYLAAELPEFNGVWLDVNKDNQAAITNYQHFGYATAGEHDDRLVMVLSTEAILKITKGS